MIGKIREGNTYGCYLIQILQAFDKLRLILVPCAKVKSLGNFQHGCL